MHIVQVVFLLICAFVCFQQTARADENLFGYVRGAETLPGDSWELYQILTSRTDKGIGVYRALDTETELEYGVSDRFSALVALKMQSIYSSDILIDAYIPKDIDSGLTPSGFEVAGKYNFLSAAKDDIGLSSFLGIDRSWLDPHSGQVKDTTSLELEFLVQKYFLEGELIGVANIGTESTYARRYHIDDLPENFEWPDYPEMEIEAKAGLGLSYRFIPNWFVGGEGIYESEQETEVGEERWSIFAGPNLHFGARSWWGTLTWFPQVVGGGPPYEDQENIKLHLIEKTKQEVRVKIGYNF